MKTRNLLITAFLLLSFTGTAWAQLDTLYAEYFTDGQLTLPWFSPWFEGDNMEVEFMEGNPSGDNWVGKITNVSSGGGVGTTTAGSINLTDYEFSANIYTTVNTGAYNGIVARCDTVGGNSFYSLQSDFDTDQRLRLREYNNANPVDIHQWVGTQIPGGVPTADSWHNMKIKFVGNQIWVYWDGQALSGSPFTDDFSSRGFFGAYIFKFSGDASTFSDDFIVLGEAGPQPYDLVAQNNTFLNQSQQPMTLRPEENQPIYFALDWAALNGIGTASPFDITLKIDNVQIFSQLQSNVTPNTQWTTISNLWTSTLGPHTLLWTIDPNNVVHESNENNNTLSEDFLVLPTTAYDFQADSAWIAMADTTPYLEDPQAGNPVRFVMAWSVPMGSGPVGAFNIKMNLDGVQYYQTSILAVQSGHNYTAVTLPWTATEGSHYFQWYIDPENYVEEFDEYNNSLMNAFDVGPAGAVKWDDQGISLSPSELSLTSVYPNPFNPSTTLSFENRRPGSLKLSIYDVTGREIAVLCDGFKPQGQWQITWDAKNIAAGTYFAVLDGLGLKSVQKLQLVK